MSDIINIRLYLPTKERVDDICRTTGMNISRTIAALVAGWASLTDRQRQTAIAESLAEKADGTARGVRRETHEALQALMQQHGMQQARFVDALVNGWHVLPDSKQFAAIKASVPEDEPATATS